MPKHGRRPNYTDKEVLDDSQTTQKFSPYGNLQTPNVRYRIIGGKFIPVVEDQRYLPDHAGRNVYTGVRTVNSVPEKVTNYDPQSQRTFGHGTVGYNDASLLNHKSVYDERLSRLSNHNDANRYNVLPPISNSSPHPDNTNGLNTSRAPDDYSSQIQLQQQQQQYQPQYEPQQYQTHPTNSFEPTSEEEALQNAFNKLPQNGSIPAYSISLTAKEQWALMSKCQKQLYGVTIQKLKDVYVDLTGFDRQLTGQIHFDDLVFSAHRKQLHIDKQLLRLVSSMFVISAAVCFVNYEKILAFLGASVKGNFGKNPFEPEIRANGISPHVDPSAAWNASPRSVGLKTAYPHSHQNQNAYNDYNKSYNSAPAQMSQQMIGEKYRAAENERDEPISDRVHPTEYNMAPTDTRTFSRAEVDYTKAFAMLRDSMADFSREDFNRLVDAFYLWDSDKRGTLDKEDIKTICYRQTLPLTNVVLEKILEKCYSRFDQYDWKRFVAYVESALPSTIQTAKMDTEIAPEHIANGMSQHNPRTANDGMVDNEKSWFDRFLRLSKALYTVDSKYVGQLPPDDIRWISNEYNRVYQLNFSAHDIEKTILQSMTKKGMVNIDTYLRTLSLAGSKPRPRLP